MLAGGKHTEICSRKLRMTSFLNLMTLL